MAKLYRRPLLTFYLALPPNTADRGEDFRTLPESYSRADEPMLDALLRDIRARQAIVRAILEDDDDVEPATWIGSLTIADGVRKASNVISNWLPLTMVDFRAQRSAEDAFKALRNSLESQGVFVLLVGDLGSHHTSFDVDTFRGFALADTFAPFVVINNNDSRAAWSYTLLHELTHLWLGQTGVSAIHGNNPVEQFCNDTASAILLPESDLNKLVVDNWDDFEVCATAISTFASSLNLSSSLVAYRLFRNTTIDIRTWNNLAGFFRKQWFTNHMHRKTASRKQSAGPDWYVVRQHRLGRSLVGTVSRMMRTGALSTSKASQVLGVKPTQLQPLLRTYFGDQ
jgi:Zn-dependent peptidase ImmA (M78 family)